jgi:hypothetical protein
MEGADAQSLVHDRAGIFSQYWLTPSFEATSSSHSLWKQYLMRDLLPWSSFHEFVHVMSCNEESLTRNLSSCDTSSDSYSSDSRNDDDSLHDWRLECFSPHFLSGIFICVDNYSRKEVAE